MPFTNKLKISHALFLAVKILLGRGNKICITLIRNGKKTFKTLLPCKSHPPALKFLRSPLLGADFANFRPLSAQHVLQFTHKKYRLSRLRSDWILSRGQTGDWQSAAPAALTFATSAVPPHTTRRRKRERIDTLKKHGLHDDDAGFHLSTRTLLARTVFRYLECTKALDIICCFRYKKFWGDYVKSEEKSMRKSRGNSIFALQHLIVC